MSEVIIQYQNANQSFQNVIDNFVIRKKEFERILSELKNTSKEDSYEHFVFVGRRGSGKSTLLRRIQAEIEVNESLKADYIAVNLGEEQSGIYKLYDLWVYTIKDLNTQNFKIPEVDFRTYKNDLKAYSRVLHQQIIEALRKTDKRLVLLIDNIDRVLKNAGEDTALLRELLMNFKEIRIIGGSTVMSEHFWKYDLPFYQFFSIKRLESLSLADIETILIHWANILGVPEIKNIINKYPGKIQSIRMLTDGLPRTMLLFVDMLLKRTEQNGYSYLQAIVDKATPIFQERLNILSPAQSKVITELAFFWEAASVEQMIQPCSMDGKTISALLSQLVSLRFVEKLKTDNKNNLYRLEERFFNLWINMTQGGPQQRYEAKALTEFLETWYNNSELQELAEDFSKKLSQTGMKVDYAESMSHALLKSKAIASDTKEDLILGLTKHSSNISQNLIKETFGDFDSSVRKAFEEKDYRKAIEILKISDFPIINLNFGLGLANDKLGNKDLAEKYYKLAADDNRGLDRASYNLAFLYNEEGKIELSEKYYKKAIEKGTLIEAIFNLAMLYQNQGKTTLAEKYYLEAIDKGYADAITNLANLYYDEGKTDVAEKYYKRAIEEGDINGFNNLLVFYYNQQNKHKLKDILKHKMFEDWSKNNIDKNTIFLLYLGEMDAFYKGYQEYSIHKIELFSDAFLIDLLIHQQSQTVFDYFQTEEKAKEAYKPLWYVVLNILEHKEFQKMPPELTEIVTDIIGEINSKQALFYPHLKKSKS